MGNEGRSGEVAPLGGRGPGHNPVLTLLYSAMHSCETGGSGAEAMATVTILTIIMKCSNATCAFTDERTVTRSSGVNERSEHALILLTYRLIKHSSYHRASHS